MPPTDWSKNSFSSAAAQVASSSSSHNSEAKAPTKDLNKMISMQVLAATNICPYYARLFWMKQIILYMCVSLLKQARVPTGVGQHPRGQHPSPHDDFFSLSVASYIGRSYQLSFPSGVISHHITLYPFTNHRLLIQ